MTTPLYGTDLIDCARANAPFGIEVAAQRCGYDDVNLFQQELIQACKAIGIDIQGFDDLNKSSTVAEQGIDVAPESLDQF